MIQISIKNAIRHLYRNKLFTVVNMVGLSVGFIASFYLASYIHHESSFDNYHPDGTNTFRLLSLQGNGDEVNNLSAINFLPIAEFIDEDIPEVDYVVRLKMNQVVNLQIGEEFVTEKDFAWADETIFDVFNMPFIHGSPLSALSDPNSIVLTETKASQYFDNKNPVGEVILLDSMLMKVTGVIKDAPDNTHINPSMIGSMSTYPNLEDPWAHQGYLYLRLHPQSSHQKVASKITSSISSQIWWLKTPPSYQLQKLQDIHLYSAGITGSTAPLDIQYLFIFAAISLILIFSTAFNYISLSIANFSVRTKEVAMRKILGANSKTLLVQPLIECFLLSASAASLAILVLFLMLPDINSLLQTQISGSFLIGMPNAFILFSVFLLMFLLSGVYPAFRMLQSFPKNNFLDSKLPVRNILIRKSLLTVQFAVALILTVSLIAIHKQMEFLGQQKLGFEKKQVLVLKTPKFNELNSLVLKNRLQQLTGVSHVSAAVGTPFGGGILSSIKVEDQVHRLSEFIVDADYISALGLNLVEGRDFVLSDSNRVIVNETMVQAMGWDHALGQNLKGFLGNDMEVVGVVMDFHLNDTNAPVHPVMITMGKQYTSNLIARLDTRDLAYTLGQISDLWKEVEPKHPMEYHFLDEQFNELYKSEIQFKDLSGIFSGIAVIIACLGLYGFIAFSVQQRIKEIGIRKVMGAPVFGILMLLSRDFLKLIGIAFLISAPIAWLLMSRWLEDFAYRIDLEWWMFALAGLAAVVIALVTVSFQTVKAALMNPVESIRTQ